MRLFLTMAAAVLAAGIALAGCARIVGQLDAQNAVKNATSCMQGVWATPEGQLLSARLWRFNEMDTAIPSQKKNRTRWSLFTTKRSHANR
jgi:hypothetical protein